MLRVADAYARHAVRSSVLAGDVGRSDVRHGDCVSTERMTRGTGWFRLRETDSQHSVPNAIARLECRGIHELSRQYCRGPPSSKNPRLKREWTCSACSIRSTGRRTCAVAMDAVCDEAGCPLRSGYLLHGRHSQPRSRHEIRPQILRDAWPRNWRKRGAHLLAIKDMAGTVQARRGRRRWSKR